MRRARAVTATLAIVAAVTGAVAGLARPAWAHVEVQPAEAAAGQPASFAFRVPNEESAANTVSLEVRFPGDHPVPDVAATAPGGWTVDVANRPLATPMTVGTTAVTEVVETVTWRGSLPPGKAEYLSITTGPLPTDAGQLFFTAKQTYDNGVVVDWNQAETPGGPEVAHPAPVLRITGGAVPTPITAAAAGGHDGVSAGVVLGAVVVAVAAIVVITTVLYRRIGRTRVKPAGRGR